MKLLAVLLLVNNISAISLRDDTDVTDLFNDDSQAEETLKSIKEAEKVSGKELPASIADQNMKEILTQKSIVHFDKDDEFIKLAKGTTADKELV